MDRPCNNDDKDIMTTTSLDILKPEPWVPQKPMNVRGQTAETLEQLTTSFFEIFCNQDFSNPLLEYASPKFQAYFGWNESETRNLEEHIAFHKLMAQKNPGWVYEVLAVSADVDEEKGVASVWATLRVTGHPVKIQRESVTILWWRRRRGVWRAYKQFGIRGVTWFDDL